jgi:hypothetical protein
MSDIQYYVNPIAYGLHALHKDIPYSDMLFLLSVARLYGE